MKSKEELVVKERQEEETHAKALKLAEQKVEEHTLRERRINDFFGILRVDWQEHTLHQATCHFRDEHDRVRRHGRRYAYDEPEEVVMKKLRDALREQLTDHRVHSCIPHRGCEMPKRGRDLSLILMLAHHREKLLEYLMQGVTFPFEHCAYCCP